MGSTCRAQKVLGTHKTGSHKEEMMRRLEIINGPNNNFYGIRNKGQYGNQLYADLIQELTEYGATLGFEVHAFQSNGEGPLIDHLQELYR